MGIYDTIGEDLVAMVVDDLVVCGAEPLFMTDYIAVGKVIPERIAEIAQGNCIWLCQSQHSVNWRRDRRTPRSSQRR